MKEYIKISVKATGIILVMMVLCGIIYTTAVTAIGQLFFNKKANGNIIKVDGKNYGSVSLAQQFTNEKHMWGRAMNIDVKTYKDQQGNAVMYASPSNLSPKSKEYKEIVDQRVEMILKSQPGKDIKKIPVDMVTCSGSGLDPEISVAAAQYQVPRIAQNNNISEEHVKKIIDKCTNKKLFGIFGEETVNVLKVNLYLDGILK